MTPSQQVEQAYADKIEAQEKASNWHVPLFSKKRYELSTLSKALESMEDFKLDQSDIPLIIKLAENPKYDIGLFAGYVDLFSHDCIHVLLGRGLLLKDEAFVIGYTMGSTKKMLRWRRNLFMFICKYLYPEGYRFGEEERYVFNSAVALGSRCPTDLSRVNFRVVANCRLSNLRRDLGINVKDINSFYALEQRLFKDSKESQRLL
jgi:hypothetical protein